MPGRCGWWATGARSRPRTTAAPPGRTARWPTTSCSTPCPFRTWEKRPVGTEKTLFGVSFATTEKGWAVGIDGLILRTRDAGQTWEVQHGALAIESLEELGFLETLKNPGLYDVRMAGQQGVVVGDTGNLMTTADGGETWTARELPEKQRLVWLRGVSLLPDGSAGFAVGAGGFMAAIDHGQIVLPANARRAAAGL